MLLVPGYIGTTDVRGLADSIASCDPIVPTDLLDLYPHNITTDLPCTSRAYAEAAVKASLEAGLTNVRVGTRGLLSSAQYNLH